MPLALLPLAVLFGSPLSALAVAGAAVSIPVIIHLLNRRRYRVVVWAAMRFLLAAQKKNSRRMRLEQLLLLILRCAVVLLLVLAMASVSAWAESVWRWANPEGGRGGVGGGLRTHKVLVLDASFSMSLKGGDGTSFDRARALAERVVQESTPGDGFSVVLLADPPRRVVQEPSEDGGKVVKEIQALRGTHGGGDLVGTLATVTSLVDASPAKYPAREVYFFTDLQKSCWLDGRPADLAAAAQAFKKKNARAVFVDVGQDNVGNLAVTHLEVGTPVVTTRAETPIVATLHNYGDARDEVRVRLLVGRARAEEGDRALEPDRLSAAGVQTLPLKGKQQTPVAFKYKFPRPGDYLVRVVVDHDGLEVDDGRGAVVTVKDTVPVLLVNGKPAGKAFDRATEWLRVALNPFGEREEVPAYLTARPKVLSREQFADEALGDLAGYDCVFLCDVPRFSPAEVRRLEAHVRRGGSAVFCLGNQVDLKEYNDALYKGGQGLLPARLLSKAPAPEGWAFHLDLPAGAEKEDPLKPFGDKSARQLLRGARFARFVQVEPVAKPRPSAVLSFVPEEVPGRAAEAGRSPRPAGGPALLEWRPPAPRPADAPREAAGGRLRGRVLLWTTTANADWNNFPPNPSFPPLMNELLDYATAPRLRGRSVGVGEALELHLAGPEGAEAKVFTPDGRVEAAKAQRLEEASVVSWTDTDVSGAYKVVVGRHPREHLFAVNVPAAAAQGPSESNIQRADKGSLTKAYQDLDPQVVTDLAKVVHATAGGDGEVAYAPQGAGVARVLLALVLLLALVEVVLAWRFAHHSAAAGAEANAAPRGARALAAAPAVLFAALGCVLFVLAHDAVTGDFLGFLPDALRHGVERWVGVAPPAPGEGSRWRLEYAGLLFGDRNDVVLAALFGLAAAGLVVVVYLFEGGTAGGRARAAMVGLRVGLVVLLLAVFLPQLRLHFERQGWPDVVLILDDSHSMSALDVYRDPRVKAAADGLADKARLSAEEQGRLARELGSRPELTRADRLRLAKTLVNPGSGDWLTRLLSKRKFRLHVYRCSSRAYRVADVTTPEDVQAALEAVEKVQAEPRHDSTQLGSVVRQVLNEFRGTSLAAVVLLTDGVTTEGDGLGPASRYASQLGVPLYFVGLGDARELRDVYLHDVQAEDSVYVHDRVVFELRVSAKGYDGLNLAVELFEKVGDKLGPRLDQKTVALDAGTKTAKVRLAHRPTKEGQKVYVIKVPVQDGEVNKRNNVVEKPVLVREAKQLKVLYVEGYRRYEYHYLKTLLERESARVKGNKSIDLKVLLLDADDDFPRVDQTARGSWPTRFRNVEVHKDDDDLWSYDVVILGDVDPRPKGDGKMTEHLKDLADFVRERGGGLLMLAGERYAPRAYKDTPLKDVLPIDVTGGADAEEVALTDTYRAERTPVGRLHPVFRFTPDDAENDQIWGRLREMYWHADGYEPKRAAEVLAVHPRRSAGGKEADAGSSDRRHPLVLQQFVGAGRSMFFGFNETWRWNWRQDQLHFNQFWVQTVRYLARSRVGRVELRLDRQTPYRRGEPIKVTVRFPDDKPPPPARTVVEVKVERRAPGRLADVETRRVRLAKVAGSRATYEALLTQTPEGEYTFTLTQPTGEVPTPQAECVVEAPPGELPALPMNQAEMELAAAETNGKFYTLADADRLPEELPSGSRVAVNASGPPLLFWNSPLLFLLALGLITAEWLCRKQKNLL